MLANCGTSANVRSENTAWDPTKPSSLYRETATFWANGRFWLSWGPLSSSLRGLAAVMIWPDTVSSGETVIDARTRRQPASTGATTSINTSRATARRRRGRLDTRSSCQINAGNRHR